MKLNPSLLSQHLDYLKLPFIQKHHTELAQQGAQQHWDHVEYLRRLIEGEYTERRQRVIERRVKAARFPVLKTLEQFRWDWPKKINRLQVQNLFRLEFVAQKANVVLLGNVGLGQNASGHRLGLRRLSGRLLGPLCRRHQRHQRSRPPPKSEACSNASSRNIWPRNFCSWTNSGYLPIDQHGADLLFQVISQRYERGSIVLTTNKPFKQWASIFNNDSTIASAVLDRLLHHAETVVIEGTSYRMKDQVNP